MASEMTDAIEMASTQDQWESLMIKVPGGSTVVMDTLRFPSDGGEYRDITVSEVLAVVEERTGIPADVLELRGIKGLPFDHLSQIPCKQINFNATLCGGLAGGKGGFGAMLRALAKQNTGHKTTDFGACRDLNGRRLRHVNNELKLKQWSMARERKEDAARRGVEIDSDEEKELMSTKSGINGWHLGVPSWIDHIKQKKETRTQRRKLASKRKWEDEEADVIQADLATRDVREKVTMVDTLRNSFCVVDNDIYVPYTANTTIEDWASDLKVGDMMQLKCVLKPHGLNKWYAYRAEKIASTSTDKKDDINQKQNDIKQNQSSTKIQKTALKSNNNGNGSDDDDAARMLTAVMEGFSKEKKLKKLNKQNITDEKRAMLPVDLDGKMQGIRWGGGDAWLGLLAGEIDFRGNGVVCGISEFSSVCVSGVSLVKGKWYYECELRTEGVMQVGWADHLFAGDSVNGDGVGDDIHSWSYDGCRQLKWNNGESSDYGRAWKVGDIVGCLLDLDKGEMSFTLNGDVLPRAFQGLSLSTSDTVSIPSSSSSSSSSSMDTNTSETSSSSQTTTGVGFYPAAAVEDQEILVLRVTPASLKYGPPHGYQSISEAMAVPPLDQVAPPNYAAPLAPKFNNLQENNVVVNDNVDEKAEKDTNKKDKKINKNVSTSSSTPVGLVVIEPEELSLDNIKSMKELESFGLDRLKSALMFLGVKCGGTLEQRAERLWDLKGIDINKIDPSLLAKPSKTKKQKNKT